MPKMQSLAVDRPGRFDDVHLAIVTPTLFEVTAAYCTSMLGLTRHLSAQGVAYGTCIQTGCTLLGEARSALVASFLSSRGTHLLMIDSDVEFPPDLAVRLLDADRDVVGAAVPSKILNFDRAFAEARRGHAAPATFLQDFSTQIFGPSDEIQAGVIEVEHMAPGFVLFKRSVLERMVAAYPELTCTTSLYAKGSICFLFQQMIEDGVVAGEDVSFLRWRKIGGRCHLLVDADIGHLGRYNFVGNYGRAHANASSPVVPLPAASINLSSRASSLAPSLRDRSRVELTSPCPCGSGRELRACHGASS